MQQSLVKFFLAELLTRSPKADFFNRPDCCTTKSIIFPGFPLYRSYLITWSKNVAD
jgi:hypothetical protein